MKKDHPLNQNIPNILIVDDVHANLNILSIILEDEGYKVRPVTNGKLALQVAQKEKPDLILLDIMMPGMDGFEVCRQLKDNQELKDIPVIFISALNETKDIVKALNSGGVDYIAKPFQAEEVRARVSTHLQLYQQKKELQEKRNELQKLNLEKDKFFAIIAHDLRSPFNAFLGLTQIMAEDLQSLTMQEIQLIAVNMRQSATNFYSLLENMLEWAKIQRETISFDPKSNELLPLVVESMKAIVEPAKNKEIDVTINIPDRMKVFADYHMLQTVLRNLISNAVKFTHRKGKITISSKTTIDNAVEIAIKDSGIGMTSKMVDGLFQLNLDTCRKGTENEASTGLGLIICKDFIEIHSGKLWVESEDGNGSTFYISLPNQRP